MDPHTLLYYETHTLTERWAMDNPQLIPVLARDLAKEKRKNNIMRNTLLTIYNHPGRVPLTNEPDNIGEAEGIRKQAQIAGEGLEKERRCE